MSFISIRQLTKTYDNGRIHALRGIDIDIEEGEMFGLVGPDGAGKTSLFRILATLLLPTSGTAVVDGQDVVRSYRRLRRSIGYMPGTFSLYRDLTVAENLHFFADLFGVSVAENYPLIRDIYDQLAPFRDRPAGKLSGGMKQKLALCCTLIHAPRLLLLDEPSTGVDPVSRRELWAMLNRLNRERGLTIVASTPYREEIALCRRVALLAEGQVTAVGDPTEVLPPETTLTTRPRPDEARPVIVAEGLTKQFGTFTACDHISFEVGRGEIFGFLGANGAGKTTAMRMLTGLSLPTDGRAVVAGCDVATEAETLKRRIGYMSQRFALYDDLTVEENLRLFGGIYGMSPTDIARRSEELMVQLDMAAERHTLVGTMPLGRKQRLAFSVAIFHHPAIVFLDEPTGGVDADARRRFWQLIYDAADRGITIFVTTHYMDEADYCDRVSIMVDGRIAALDTPTRLKAQYGATSMYDVFFALARTARRS